MSPPLTLINAPQQRTKNFTSCKNENPLNSGRTDSTKETQKIVYVGSILLSTQKVLYLPQVKTSVKFGGCFDWG